MKVITLVLLNESAYYDGWDLGDIFSCDSNPQKINELIIEQLGSNNSDAWLFWDPLLDLPDQAYILSKLSEPVDVWHAGLKLGLVGQPEMINFVQPTWMLNRDPAPNIEATSWRLSLRACLVRTEVLRQVGGPNPNFESLAGCSVEMGYRYILKGVFIRHDPSLLSCDISNEHEAIPIIDQLRFIHTNSGRRWLFWASSRAILKGLIKPRAIYQVLENVLAEELNPQRGHFCHLGELPGTKNLTEKVSVLIPTINRYPYLRKILGQLREQTVPPFEILIVDQTPKKSRDPELMIDFQDLPIQYLTLDEAGQSISRNAGLQSARGEYVLFLDDDVEAPPDLIESHLRNLNIFQSCISSGVVYETDPGELAKDFRFLRVSNVFPGGNSMIKKNVLYKTGLFDLAYDHGQRADHDLGMRLYFSGEMMILDPSIAILHHHAPKGGLREHKARVDTRSASRRKLFKFNLPTVSDIYLAKRYFSSFQVKEMLWIGILGTFSHKSGGLKQLLKVMVSTLFLPYHLQILYKRNKAADELLGSYPQIPTLGKSHK